MAKHPTIVHLPNRNLTGHGANDLLLVLGAAAFMLGVRLVGASMLLSQPAILLVPTPHTAQGQVASVVTAREERSVATTPLADRASSTPLSSIVSRLETGVVAACLPRLALTCDLRLGLMQMALLQRGFSLGRQHAPSSQEVPAKYRALACADASAAPDCGIAARYSTSRTRPRLLAGFVGSESQKRAIGCPQCPRAPPPTGQPNRRWSCCVSG
jgi:hypothetical protein